MLISLEMLNKKYNLNINGILHIGAHLCEELKMYKKQGINEDKIIWIEANPKLVKHNKKHNNKLIIKNFICCDKDEGYTKLNISNNGQSSSILELGTHKINHPGVKYVGSVEVKNNRIDTMYKEDNIPENFANFLNIDIQGSELLALKGMGNLLNNFDYALLEVNKEYVYENCAIINEIDAYMSKFNFIRVETKWTRNKWGDAFYIKINNDFKLLKNVRCTKEIWEVKNITFKQALEKAKNDKRVKALHWYNKNGDGRIDGVKGWYQGAGGEIGKIKNKSWDTIIL